MSRKFHRLLPKRFGDSKKFVIFEASAEANFVDTGDRNYFFIFLIMLPNYVSTESFTGQRKKLLYLFYFKACFHVLILSIQVAYVLSSDLKQLACLEPKSQKTCLETNRSSYQRCSVRKGVLRSFTSFILIQT